MTIDSKKFTEALARAVADQGERIPELRHPGTDDTPPDVAAAAITVSVLIVLRSFTEHRSLTYQDVQTAIDAFMGAAGVSEKRSRLGGSDIVRKV